MRILSVETSCDETAIAIVECSGSKKRPEISVLSNLVSSQVKLHAKYGGVVPNLARREHERNLVPLLLQALDKSRLLQSESRIMNQESRKRKTNKTNLHDSLCIIHDSILNREPELLAQFEKHIMPLPAPTVDAIAVTNGPGLAPALWVGVNFARALAILWKKPLIPVNHMEGHLYSALLNIYEVQPHKLSYETRSRKMGFPALGLLVSGGHTELVLVRWFGKYDIIGETQDDAAGEAFDKVARLLGLDYPGGPAIAKEAAKIKNEKLKNLSRAATREKNDNAKLKIELPRPMLHSKDYNFSFSGLKTAVLYLVRDLQKSKKNIKKYRPFIAKEFQDAVVDVLVAKTIHAAKEYKVKTILLGGGVAANADLRKRLADECRQNMPKSKILLPHVAITGDNALMIALAAYLTGKKKAPIKVGAEANLRLG